MNALYLTAAEKSIFDALSEELKEEWEVIDETLTFEDSKAHRDMRVRFARIHDPKLQEFIDAALQAASEKELADLIIATDLTDVNEGDISQLFFVLGPSAISAVIAHLLGQVQSDSDIEDLIPFMVIRNSLLNSLQKK